MILILIHLFFLSISNPNQKSPKDFIWENRILIIQSGETDFDWLDENLKKDLITRKLLVFQFEGDRLAKTNFEGKVDASKFLEMVESKTTKSNHWVLIGLDGGIKNRGSKPVFPVEIFRIIDSMPMRQSEIKSTQY
jgi:hypothetical protein